MVFQRFYANFLKFHATLVTIQRNTVQRYGIGEFQFETIDIIQIDIQCFNIIVPTQINLTFNINSNIFLNDLIAYGAKIDNL